MVRRRLPAVLLTAAVLLGLSSTAAYAYWQATGTGSGTIGAGTWSSVTATLTLSPVTQIGSSQKANLSGTTNSNTATISFEFCQVKTGQDCTTFVVTQTDATTVPNPAASWGVVSSTSKYAGAWKVRAKQTVNSSAVYSNVQSFSF